MPNAEVCVFRCVASVAALFDLYRKTNKKEKRKMAFLIILLAVLISGACIGLGVAILKNIFLADISERLEENSTQNVNKRKICSSVLIVLNGFGLINSINSLVIFYSDWVSDNNSFLNIISQIFEVSTMLLLIAFGIFMLVGLKNFIILSSASIEFLTLFNVIYIHPQPISIFYNGYFTYLPICILFLSLIVICGETDPFYSRYKNILKFVPFALLLNPLNIIIYSIKSNSLQSYIVSLILAIAEFVAFLGLFDAILSSNKEEYNVVNKSKPASIKEMVILMSSILILPLFISLLSFVDTVWLLIATIFLALSIPFVFVFTKGASRKKRIIALICVVATVVIFIIITAIIPSYDRVGDICGACGGDGKYNGKECPACHGFGVYVD